ncbi:hypothetical protein ACFW3D_30335 [Streptomyces sp. NPDC058864]
MLGHWTGSVFYALLAIVSLVSAVRHSVQRQWTAVVRDTSGMLGFACLSSIGDGPHLPAAFVVAMFFCAIALAAELRIKFDKRKKQSAA